jgi:hypothetical protein
MFKVFASSLLVLAFSSFSFASDTGGKGDGPCAADVKQFCSSVEKGGGRIMKCLHENNDKLSPACKESNAKMKEDMKEMKAACHEDVEKFCGDVHGGKGRIVKCMKEHKSELSAGCKTEVEQMKEHRQERRGK